MPAFKFVISEPETRKSYQLEADQAKAVGLIGKKINDEFDGTVIGLEGYSLKITGGTDKDGFPMHPSVAGIGRKKVLLASPPGFHPKLKGQRRRKMVCGNAISESITQVNVKIIKKGQKPIEELVPVKVKEKVEKKEEAEEKKPEKVEEKPAEKKEEPAKKVEEKTEAKEKKEEVKKGEGDKQGS